MQKSTTKKTRSVLFSCLILTSTSLVFGAEEEHKEQCPVIKQKSLSTKALVEAALHNADLAATGIGGLLTLVKKDSELGKYLFVGGLTCRATRFALEKSSKINNGLSSEAGSMLLPLALYSGRIPNATVAGFLAGSAAARRTRALKEHQLQPTKQKRHSLSIT